ARTRHGGHITETPQGHALHGRVKAEPPATSFDIPHRIHSQGNGEVRRERAPMAHIHSRSRREQPFLTVWLFMPVQCQ
ncbi:hypothetical protein ACT7I1_005322, partial [Escherichia coli]